MAAAYEAHRACSARLRAAFELGCALAEALDRKAVRVRWGRPEFEPLTGRARQAVEDLLDRQERSFYTGGAKLRVALDNLVTRHVGPHHGNVLALYFGWRYDLPITLSEGPVLSMGDCLRVRRFVDDLRAALDEVQVLVKTHAQESVTKVVEAVDEYCLRIQRFDRQLLPDMAACAIQTAWRRARDTPGYAVWRRRMLAEFEELSALC